MTLLQLPEEMGVDIGPLHLPAYFIMLSLGVVFCNYRILFQTDHTTVKIPDVITMEILGGLAALIGAKLLYLVEHSANLTQIAEAGYSYYGGLAAFLLTAAGYCKVKKVEGRKYAEECFYLIPLLQVFWKIGCFMGGCCFGIPYQGALAIIYPQNKNIVSGIPIFPVQLLEALEALIIALILYAGGKRKKIESYSGVFLLLYGSSRFFTEYFRYQEKESVLTQGQICSIISVLIGIALIYRSYKAEREER